MEREKEGSPPPFFCPPSKKINLDPFSRGPNRGKSPLEIATGDKKEARSWKNGDYFAHFVFLKI